MYTGGTVTINQMQGIKSFDEAPVGTARWDSGRRRKQKNTWGLAEVNWRDVLVDTVTQTCQRSDFGTFGLDRMVIRSADNNYWLMHDENRPRSEEGQRKFREDYDDYAQSRGFRRQADGNWGMRLG